jgi:hypothetical protein
VAGDRSPDPRATGSPAISGDAGTTPGKGGCYAARSGPDQYVSRLAGSGKRRSTPASSM